MIAAVQIQLIDPSAYTPPYDHALAAALVRAGASVELVTSRFVYGELPPADGHAVRESFYPLSSRLGPRARGRRALKLAEHVPGMMRLRFDVRRADVVHYQWLTVQPLDVHLLPPRRPRVLTAHDVLPREPRRGQIAATRRLLRAMDAVVVHSRHGARRLTDEVGVDPSAVSVIPHGVFDYLTRLPDERPLPAPLAAVDRPVVLFFGLLRPYKGLEVLLEAFAAVADAELWVVGMPRMALGPLEARARGAAGRVRLVTRFVPDRELPAYFRRADIVVLPYLDTDQSGVLATALAFAKPVVASAVGGFVETAEDHGAAAVVPPGDSGALAAKLNLLLAERDERERLGSAAARAAAGPLSWDHAAELTMKLYRDLLDR